MRKRISILLLNEVFESRRKTMRKGKRVLLLSVIMCIVIAGTAAAVGKPGTAIVDEVKTISFMTQDNKYAPRSYTQGLPVWKKIEENLGIIIDWRVAPRAQYSEMLNITMATGEDLPDVIWAVDGQKYGEMGLLVDINPLIEKYSPPNILKKFAEQPLAKLVGMTPEGKMYEIWNGQLDKYNFSRGICIRADWLEELNLKAPTTSEEFVNVMKRFRDEDMNGNGKPDEYLVFDQWSGYWKVLGNIFGLHLVYSGGFYPDKDGKIQCEWTSPKAKAFAEWMNMLYDEQILEPEFLMTNRDRYIAMINKNKVGAVIGGVDDFLWIRDLMKESVPGVEFIGLLALKGPFGDQMVEVQMGIDNPTSISKDADPELAIKFIDYLWSHEANMLRDFGIEGETYTIENGKIIHADKVLNNPDGLDMSSVKRSYGCYWNGPRWVTDEFHQEGWSSDRAKYAILNRPYYQVQSSHTLMKYSEAELEIVKTYKTDIDTYIEENFVKFSIGEKDINEFDDFVDKLNSMGLDKLIQVYQQQRNRYLEMMKE